MIELLVSLSLVVGASFALIGSIGLARLPDFYTRLHGPTKATTLGVGGMLLASAIHFSSGSGISVHEVLVTLFLFMTAPVSAHMACKAALHLPVRHVSGGWPEEDAALPEPPLDPAAPPRDDLPARQRDEPPAP